ncbi:hypothetical protein GEMRC1_011067 [Eukaryota sp. GEM-RC1]
MSSLEVLPFTRYVVLATLLYDGRAQSVAAFAKDMGLEFFISVDRISQRREACTLIRSGKISEAIHIIHQHSPFLFQTRHDLCFQLYIQNFVEQFKANPSAWQDILENSSHELSDLVAFNPGYLDALSEVSLLLVTEGNPSLQDQLQLSHLLDEKKRVALAQNLNEALITEEGWLNEEFSNCIPSLRRLYQHFEQLKMMDSV